MLLWWVANAAVVGCPCCCGGLPMLLWSVAHAAVVGCPCCCDGLPMLLWSVAHASLVIWQNLTDISSLRGYLMFYVKSIANVFSLSLSLNFFIHFFFF